MNNQEYVDYIHSKLLEYFPDILIEKSITENLPNDNFIVIFENHGVKISFVKDRGYLNGEIMKDNKYTSFTKIDNSIQNIWLEGTKDIDLIVKSLINKKDEIFKE